MLSHSVMSDPMVCSPPGSSVHGDSPDKNTGVGCHVLLQGIFPTQGLNSDLLHCRWILYHLSHQGSPDSHLFMPSQTKSEFAIALWSCGFASFLASFSPSFLPSFLPPHWATIPWGHPDSKVNISTPALPTCGFSPLTLSCSWEPSMPIGQNPIARMLSGWNLYQGRPHSQSRLHHAPSLVLLPQSPVCVQGRRAVWNMLPLSAPRCEDGSRPEWEVELTPMISLENFLWPSPPHHCSDHLQYKG